MKGNGGSEIGLNGNDKTGNIGMFTSQGYLFSLRLTENR
jgi:hypothetical protein